MSNPFFEHPILNSPYDYPSRHWELDEAGQPTQKIIEHRRGAKFITPIPKPKKRKAPAKQTGFVFDEGKGLSTKDQQYDPTSIINEVRQSVEALGLPVVCVETFQAHQFLKSQRNKTDKNDARGLAQFMRMGGDYIRPVIVKDTITQEDRMLLTLRQKYVREKVAIENAITGVLKPFGVVVPRGWQSADSFCKAYAETIAKAGSLGPIIREAVLDSIDANRVVNDTLAKLTKQIERIAKEHSVCRRLMTAPGVGPIVALSFVTAIDTPHRFRRSEDVGAYLGLTPKKYQSGDMERDVGISKFGSSMTRVHLVQAATTLLYSSKKWSTLRAWGMKIAKRRGYHIARIAVARKLAIILHRMWINEQDFRWSTNDGVGRRSPVRQLVTSRPSHRRRLAPDRDGRSAPRSRAPFDPRQRDA